MDTFHSFLVISKGLFPPERREKVSPMFPIEAHHFTTVKHPPMRSTMDYRTNVPPDRRDLKRVTTHSIGGRLHLPSFLESFGNLHCPFKDEGRCVAMIPLRRNLTDGKRGYTNGIHPFPHQSLCQCIKCVFNFFFHLNGFLLGKCLWHQSL